MKIKYSVDIVFDGAEKHDIDNFIRQINSFIFDVLNGQEAYDLSVSAEHSTFIRILETT